MACRGWGVAMVWLAAALDSTSALPLRVVDQPATSPQTVQARSGRLVLFGEYRIIFGNHQSCFFGVTGFAG